MIAQDDLEYITEQVINNIKQKYYLVEKGSDLKSEIKDREIHIEKIIDDICELKGVVREKLTTKIKIRTYTDCRMLIYYIIRKIYPIVTLQKIGSYFNRDHSSVVQQLKLTQEILEVDKVFRVQVENLLNKFKSEM